MTYDWINEVFDLLTKNHDFKYKEVLDNFIFVKEVMKS